VNVSKPNWQIAAQFGLKTLMSACQFDHFYKGISLLTRAVLGQQWMASNTDWAKGTRTAAAETAVYVVGLDEAEIAKM